MIELCMTSALIADRDEVVYTCTNLVDIFINAGCQEDVVRLAAATAGSGAMTADSGEEVLDTCRAAMTTTLG